MKPNNFVLLFFCWIVVTTQSFAEPTVFGFGTSEPSESLERKNQREIALLKKKIEEQNERIDGLTSIIEGLNVAIGELKNGQGTTGGSNNTALLKKLGEMIDKIENDYVSKEVFEKAMGEKVTTKTTPKEAVTHKEASEESKPSEVTESSGSLEREETSNLYSEGARLFAKKRYAEAKKRFVITDTKGYKPAASNYYLGEIAYYTKKYDDAIFYYKKSAGLHDKASYIDVLLLHTAVSLELIGDKAQAKMFYENIVENYQGKKSAEIAQEKLKRL